MHADSFFFIGKQHSVCQDYARAGIKNNSVFAIVSDGCSGSPDTDFGARILVQFFVNVLTEDDLSFNTQAENEAIFRLGGRTVCLQLQNDLQLPDVSMDATLMMVMARNNRSVINVIGDGAIALIDKDNNVNITEIEYPSGAPRYLSYWIDEDRHNQYKKEFGTKTIIKNYTLDQPDLKIESEFDGMVWNIVINDANYKAIVLFSDGVHSIQKSVETDTGRTFEPVHTGQVLQELLAYKSYTGEFIKRRTKRFIKEMQKKGWVNNDDLSVAGIYLGD